MKPAIETESVKVYDDDLDIINFLTDMGRANILSICQQHDKDVQNLFNEKGVWYLVMKFAGETDDSDDKGLMLVESESKLEMAKCIKHMEETIGPEGTERLITVLTT